MKIPLAVSLALALGVAAGTVPAPARASATIQRCLSADGSFAYTDKGCATLGATALPLPHDLERRLAREERAGDGAADIGRDAAPVGRAASRPAPSPAVRAAPRRASGCARSPRQLAADLRTSLAQGDVNRLAESYHWAGMSSRAGERALARLERLSGRGVVEAAYYAARTGGAGASGYADAGALLASAAPPRSGDDDAGALELVLGGGGTRSVVDFEVRRHADCYFVAF